MATLQKIDELADGLNTIERRTVSPDRSNKRDD